MMDHGMIFSAPMVKALLAGTKTQTRRVLKPYIPVPGRRTVSVDFDRLVCTKTSDKHSINIAGPSFLLPCATGDRLWVREAHSLHRAHGQDYAKRSDDHGVRWGPWSGLPTMVSPDKTEIAYYREGFDRSGPPRWRPSIHMPRWASRLTLTVTGVWVQRLQDISNEDAKAEGVLGECAFHVGNADTYRAPFCELWKSLHGPGAWEANPWVMAITFTVQNGNIGPKVTP